MRLVTRLHQWDVLRANKAPFAWGLETRVPFLDKQFLQVGCPGRGGEGSGLVQGAGVRAPGRGYVAQWRGQAAAPAMHDEVGMHGKRAGGGGRQCGGANRAAWQGLASCCCKGGPGGWSAGRLVLHATQGAVLSLLCPACRMGRWVGLMGLSPLYLSHHLLHCAPPQVAMNIDPADKMPNLKEKPDGVHPKLEK